MHKLLHINPNFTSHSSISLGFNIIPNFHSLGFINNLSNYSTNLAMSTTLHLRPLAGGSVVTGNGPIYRKPKVGRSNCGICRCNFESLVPFRAWSGLKGRRAGLRFAGYCTDSKDKVFSGKDEVFCRKDKVFSGKDEVFEVFSGKDEVFSGQDEVFSGKDGVFEVAVKNGEVGKDGVFEVAAKNGGKDGVFEGVVKSAEGEDGKDKVFKGAVKSGEVEGEVKKELEEKRRLNRRQRGNEGGVSGLIARSPDLLAIPGVGPRNLKKLVEKGIGGVAQLKRIYKDKFFGKSSEKMVEFLQGSVGIIHKNHAESITTYIKESVDEELKDDTSSLDVKPSQKKRLTFCVEGNISVGKSTFLQRIANETLELQDLVEIVPEPVNKWQDVGPDHFNILDAFYAEPERYAYTFQNYVFVTRLMQEKESSGGIKPLRLMERSVFSDRMVFVRAVHEAKWMNEMEISIYDSWFDPVVSSLPGLVPDAFIYLRASPDTCHKRMLLRKRAEEGGVSIDYLRGLHEKHESWLFPSESGNHGVFSVNKLPFHADHTLPPDIRDRVFYLGGEHMHSSIQQVPALVLDCEPNIDFNKDIEAKRQYARQVADFFQFVKKQKEDTSSEAAKSSQPDGLIPNQGGLWLPNGKHLPDSALNSLDFRQAMSCMSS
ncbi:dNK domain-containing protein [Heracleum sosnowskyi]|uniref:DNK domain-containing protein n=1 Tax=Heracleum sosnowskyi TaxID=360622 RepID=A0AAD8MG94_9APIA|nr:dNK domain-containing protein [Heracleum sosnowskyi]